MRAIVMFLAIIVTNFVYGQKIVLKPVAMEGADVVIRYDLEGEKGTAYHISLFSSHDNFAKPVRARGEVQEKRVLPGTNKTIRWNTEELLQFDGDIRFKLTADLASPLFTDIQPANGTVKRGKQVEITWVTEVKDPVRVELVKGDVRLLAGTSATGKLLYGIPKKTKPGSYQIELTAQQEITRGATLAVRPVLPTVVKFIVLGGAVAGGLFAAGVFGGGETTGGEGSLPPPPGIDN